ncbi:MAG: glycosyltransferase N-terminal domain-containing protein [candidate division Zixibacteria bacterium]
MITAYKMLVRAAHLLATPYTAVKASLGDPLWRGRRLNDLPPEARDIWIHAASIGEARMAAILVAHLKGLRPELTVHLTVVTEAGFDAACKTLGRDATVSYFPLDVPHLIGRLFETISPKVLVVAETEIWPTMVSEAHKRKVPLVLINGRMSQNAFERYKKARRLFSGLLSGYNQFFLKSETDRERYAFFGIDAGRMQVVGDMKFDAPLQVHSEKRRDEFRNWAGVEAGENLLIAGSTRPGEERQLLDLFMKVRTKHSHFRLLLAPRRLERLDEVKMLLNSLGLNWHIYSDPKAADTSGVILVDRMGLLNELYMAADIAFVGGTLEDFGGHNLLEPVWAGTPVVFGPFTKSVVESASYIENHNYGCGVKSVQELVVVLDEFLSGEKKFAQKQNVDSQHSATARASRYILDLLKGRDDVS